MLEKWSTGEKALGLGVGAVIVYGLYKAFAKPSTETAAGLVGAGGFSLIQAQPSGIPGFPSMPPGFSPPSPGPGYSPPSGTPPWPTPTPVPGSHPNAGPVAVWHDGQGGLWGMPPMPHGGPTPTPSGGGVPPTMPPWPGGPQHPNAGPVMVYHDGQGGLYNMPPVPGAGSGSWAPSSGGGTPLMPPMPGQGPQVPAQNLGRGPQFRGSSRMAVPAWSHPAAVPHR